MSERIKRLIEKRTGGRPDADRPDDDIQAADATELADAVEPAPREVVTLSLADMAVVARAIDTQQFTEGVSAVADYVGGRRARLSKRTPEGDTHTIIELPETFFIPVVADGG